ATAKPELLTLEANALNLIDARTRRVLARIPAASHPATDLALLRGSAWVLVGDERRLLRVDLASHAVTANVELPWQPAERMATGEGLVWVPEAGNLGTQVLGIDGRSGKVVRRFSIGGSSRGIAYGAGSLWLGGGAEVLRVDPRTGRTLH